MFVQSARTYLSGFSARLKERSGNAAAELKAWSGDAVAELKAWSGDAAAELKAWWSPTEEVKVSMVAMSATLALSLIVGVWPFSATPAKAAPMAATAKTESVAKAVSTAARTVAVKAAADEDKTSDPAATSQTATSTNVLAGRKVVIDPGHGTPGSGASGYGSDEATNVLAIADKLHDALVNEGATVYMTRTGMDFPGNAAGQLNVRTSIANGTGADLFVSIHNDSADANHVAHGTATYIASQDGSSSPSHQLAGSIVSAVSSQTGLTDNGIEKAPFYVLRNSNLDAAVLVEVGFVSNPSEAAALKEDSFRAQAAQGLAKGITQYFQDPQG